MVLLLVEEMRIKGMHANMFCVNSWGGQLLLFELSFLAKLKGNWEFVDILVVREAVRIF